jgi:hypothetical protein
MLNGTEWKINSKCEIEVYAQHNNFRMILTCLIIPKITGAIPNVQINLDNINIPRHLRLADPSFNLPGKIDLLLGAKRFWSILCVGQFTLGASGLVMQKTKLGWIVGGPINAAHDRVSCNLVRRDDIAENLERFWQIEECSNDRAGPPEGEACEEIFMNTFRRDPTGRFVVNMPLKDDPNKLGDSRTLALRRLMSLERKLRKNRTLKTQYEAFLTEYEKLGHMSEVGSHSESGSVYYLPHHCVLKSMSTSTKLRVVFDGSVVTSTGLSLNDIQHTGYTERFI